jgi:hypothetical protein
MQVKQGVITLSLILQVPHLTKLTMILTRSLLSSADAAKGSDDKIAPWRRPPGTPPLALLNASFACSM